MKNSLPEFRAPCIDPNGRDPFTARSEFADGLSFSRSHWRQFGPVQLVINTGYRTDHHHCLKTINPEVGSGSAPAPPNSADRTILLRGLSRLLSLSRAISVYLVFYALARKKAKFPTK